MRRDLLILFALVALVRVPFLAQAVQGDDVYYLIFARNALVDPLHPLQTGFRLQGETVWGAGHTRPPGNAWVLASLLEVFGEDGSAPEIALHAFFALFSLLAVGAVYFLARRFTDRPLWAALIFLAVPVFTVNGNKLESDLPLVAFWSLGFALLVHGRYRWSAAAMAAGSLFGYQAVFATPILAHWMWFRDRRSYPAWLAVFAAPLVLVAWQLFERATVGAAPASVLAGYAQSYDLLALERKAVSAAALLGHLGWLICPALVAIGWANGVGRRLLAGAVLVAAMISLPDYALAERLLYAIGAAAAALVVLHGVDGLRRDRAGEEGFLGAWLLVFLAASLAVFYAGSARYLLPLAPALAIWAARRVESIRLLACFTALQLLLGLALAKADADYVNRYREVVAELAPYSEGKRLWSNAEWGLRYYLGEIGGEPLLADQTLAAGALVVTSELAAAVPYGVEGSKRPLLEADISTSAVPLRLIGPGSRSGYSSSEFGVLPFGLGAGVIDRIAAYAVGLPEPTASYLEMNSDAAEQHILAGFYPSDGADWRWMGRRGTAMLRAPAEPGEFVLEFHIPDEAPARRVRVTIDGIPIADESYHATGGYTLRAPVQVESGAAVRVSIETDAAFAPVEDSRRLSIVVVGFGIR